MFKSVNHVQKNKRGPLITRTFPEFVNHEKCFKKPDTTFAFSPLNRANHMTIVS